MTEDLQARIAQLTYHWEMLFPNSPVPDFAQWMIWFEQYDEPTITKALIQLAKKFKTLNGQMSEVYMVRFASAVMRRICAESLAKEQPSQTLPQSTA